MPVHPEKGGYQWGQSGKVYRGAGAKAKAAAQGRAAYASGYRGPGMLSPQNLRKAPSRVR